MRDLHLERLEEFCVLIKLMYPHRETVNKYKKLLEQHLPKSFTTRETTLFFELVKRVTLLHQLHRYEDKWGRIYTAKDDIFIGLFLIERVKVNQLTSNLLGFTDQLFYHQLLKHFSGEQFTRLAAQHVSGLSKTNVWWKLHQLQSKGLVEQVAGYRNRGYLYELTQTN